MSALLVKLKVTLGGVTNLIEVDGHTEVTLLDLAEHALEDKGKDYGLDGLTGELYGLDLLEFSIGKNHYISSSYLM